MVWPVNKTPIKNMKCVDNSTNTSQQGPPEDPFLPLTNDIAFPKNITSAKMVYPSLNKSYNRHMILLFCPSVPNAHSTHLKFKTETCTPKRVFLKLQN